MHRLVLIFLAGLVINIYLHRFEVNVSMKQYILLIEY